MLDAAWCSLHCLSLSRRLPDAEEVTCCVRSRVLPSQSHVSRYQSKSRALDACARWRTRRACSEVLLKYYCFEDMSKA